MQGIAMTEITFLSAAETGRQIDSGKLDARDVTEAYLAAIDAHEATDRIYVRVMADSARAEAAEAAARETWEEACAKVEIGELYAVFNLPQINQVYMMFLARLDEPEFDAGSESLECRLYDEAEIPWQQLAFPTIEHTLRFFFDDRRQDRFGLHFGDIIRDGSGTVLLPRRESAT